MSRIDKTFIMLYSKDIPDVAAFLDIFNLFFEPEFEGQGKGEKTAAFKLKLKGNNIKIKQDHEQDAIKKMIQRIEDLEYRNQQLKYELELLQPKQNLAINDMLITKIKELKAKGLSFQKIADALNEEGYSNSRGNSLNAMQVSRLHKSQKES